VRGDRFVAVGDRLHDGKEGAVYFRKRIWERLATDGKEQFAKVVKVRFCCVWL